MSHSAATSMRIYAFCDNITHMAFSLSLGRILGIEVVLHWSFLLFLLFVWIALGAGGLALFVVAFTFVLLHELMHARVARHYGKGVSRIVLLPIGGMAVAEESYMEPGVEFQVAIIGPVFNLAVAALATLLLPFSSGGIADALLLVQQVNLALGAFNLLVPAIPMDGGRVLRSLLAMRMSYLKATEYAAKIAQAVALAAIALSFIAGAYYGAMGSALWISVIALFVYMGANAEYEAALLRAALQGVSVKGIMQPAPAIRASETLLAAFHAFVRMRVPALVVLPHAVLGIEDLQRVPRQRWARVRVGSVARAAPACSAKESALGALQKMAAANVEMLPVLRGRALAGVVLRRDIENLFRAMRLAVS